MAVVDTRCRPPPPPPLRAPVPDVGVPAQTQGGGGGQPATIPSSCHSWSICTVCTYSAGRAHTWGRGGRSICTSVCTYCTFALYARRGGWGCLCAATRSPLPRTGLWWGGGGVGERRGAVEALPAPSVAGDHASFTVTVRHFPGASRAAWSVAGWHADEAGHSTQIVGVLSGRVWVTVCVWRLSLRFSLVLDQAPFFSAKSEGFSRPVARTAAPDHPCHLYLRAVAPCPWLPACLSVRACPRRQIRRLSEAPNGALM